MAVSPTRAFRSIRPIGLVIPASDVGLPQQQSVGSIPLLDLYAGKSARFHELLMDFAQRWAKRIPKDMYQVTVGKPAQEARDRIKQKRCHRLKPCAKDEKSFLYELNKPITADLYELFKPFGSLNFDMGDRAGRSLCGGCLQAYSHYEAARADGHIYAKDYVLSLPIAGRSKMIEAELKFNVPDIRNIKCAQDVTLARIFAIQCDFTQQARRFDLDYAYKVDEHRCVHCFECISHFTAGATCAGSPARGKDYTGNERAIH
jgi:phosphoadenosine phosphosulfate reductase